MNFARINNISKILAFRYFVPPGLSGHLEQRCSGHGVITSVRIRFAAGENGTLKIRPVLIIPPQIQIDLFGYADGAERWIIGDNEVVENVVSIETESDALLRVYYDNTANAPDTVDSFVNVDIAVNYFEKFERDSIIGPRRKGWL